MTTKYCFVTSKLMLAAVFLVSINGPGVMAHKIKCLDQEVDLKDCFKGWMECAATIMPEEDVKAFKDPNTPKEKKKEIGKKAHNNTCIRVCQWKKHQHLLNEDGSLNKAKQDEMIDKTFPEAAREGLKTGLAKCHEEHSKDFKEDNHCESYKPFEICMKKGFSDACKLDPKTFHMDEAE